MVVTVSCFFVRVFQGKPDLNTSLPVRQTASIFKQPVTKVTNHPSNKVKTDPQKAVDQPKQVNTAISLYGETAVTLGYMLFFLKVILTNEIPNLN